MNKLTKSDFDPAKGLEINVILGAQKIFEIFCGGPVDWSAHSLEDADDTIFRSADWLQAMSYSRAALTSNQEGNDEA